VRITWAEVLPKGTIPNVVALILHCLRLFAIACKDSVKLSQQFMAFSHNLCQVFFITIHKNSNKEGIFLGQFLVTSLVSNNLLATCRIKVSRGFAFDHIWNGQYNKMCHWKCSMETTWEQLCVTPGLSLPCLPWLCLLRNHGDRSSHS